MRLGFSLWVGPSQAQTPENTAGVYIKGYAPPGTVVALYPGRTYSSEMMLKAKDFAHLANPDVPRHFVVRFDGTLIDVNGGEPRRCGAKTQQQTLTPCLLQ